MTRVRLHQFQSAPGLEAGRLARRHRAPHRDRVSIRARPRGRAIEQAIQLAESNARVSIRARPRGRAIGVMMAMVYSLEEFQSAPGLEAGRLRQSWPSSARRSGFQSAPGLEAGRLSALPVCVAFTTSFNPRPASRPGD